ncbi:MAG TPA: metallophosphoesterase [Anaerolineales bacterium]|jgi:Icc protein|nr:metallophosphoesterase [Anaerolineales bacterium]
MSDFSFIQITDHHLLESEDAHREGFVPGHALRMVMRHIAQHTAGKADFIVSTGDLVEPPTEAAYACAIQLLGLSPSAALPGPQNVNTEGLQDYPMYFLPGNHDDREMMTRGLFPQSQPLALYNLAFEHKGVQFIFMDWGPESKAVFLPETRDFLVQALTSKLPSVLICHQHVRKIGSRWLDSFLADDLDQFWQIITTPAVKEKVLGILCGHVHITYEDEYKGIQILGLRSTAYPFAKTDDVTVLLAPPHYRFVSIQNGILTSRIYKVLI